MILLNEHVKEYNKIKKRLQKTYLSNIESGWIRGKFEEHVKNIQTEGCTEPLESSYLASK